MSKKHFIALALVVRGMLSRGEISDNGIKALADFCRDQNSAFMRERWVDFIYGRCGSNGGRV